MEIITSDPDRTPDADLDPRSATEALIDRLVGEGFDPVSPEAVEALTVNPKVRAMHAGLAVAFPDARLILSWRIIEEHRAVLGGVMTGTHLGPWRGALPTGLPFEVMTMAKVDCVDGMIADLAVIVDSLSLVEQLGLVPLFGAKACEIGAR
jgi:hypothetical protein